MNKNLKTFVFGIYAGLAIGLGGTLFLIAKTFSLPILGGFLFPVGLLLICLFKFNLFTGKVGYLFNNKKDYVFDLFLMYLGNIVGAVAIGYLVRLIAPDSFVKTVESVCSAKLSKSWLEQLGSAFFCGVLVYLAVDGFKKENVKLYFRIPWLFICIAAFVILGFDHCIANMYYFAAGNAFGKDILMAVVSILVVSIGNSCGSIFVNLIKEHAKK